jgi:hypothetical protein
MEYGTAAPETRRNSGAKPERNNSLQQISYFRSFYGLPFCHCDILLPFPPEIFAGGSGAE